MKSNGIELFFETSSKTAENVRMAFEEVAKQLFHQRMSKTKAAISSAHIENMVSLKRDKLAPPELIDEIQALFDDGQYQEAMELC